MKSTANQRVKGTTGARTVRADLDAGTIEKRVSFVKLYIFSDDVNVILDERDECTSIDSNTYL